MSGEIDDETLRLAYEQALDVPAKQATHVDALDAKAAGTFTAATIVVGFTSAAGDLSAWLLAPAFFAYAVAVGCALLALRPRTWRSSTNVRDAWWALWDYTPRDYRYAVLTRIGRDARVNTILLAWKARMVRRAMNATAVEGALIAMAVLAARL